MNARDPNFVDTPDKYGNKILNHQTLFTAFVTNFISQGYPPQRLPPAWNAASNAQRNIPSQTGLGQVDLGTEGLLAWVVTPKKTTSRTDPESGETTIVTTNSPNYPGKLRSITRQLQTVLPGVNIQPPYLYDPMQSRVEFPPGPGGRVLFEFDFDKDGARIARLIIENGGENYEPGTPGTGGPFMFNF
jgi:hypothetical protein